MSAPFVLEEFLKVAYLPHKTLLFSQVNDLFEILSHSNCAEQAVEIIETHSDKGISWVGVEVEELYKLHILTILRTHGITINEDVDIQLFKLVKVLDAVVNLPSSGHLEQAALLIQGESDDPIEIGYNIFSLIVDITWSDFTMLVEDIDPALFNVIGDLVEGHRDTGDGLLLAIDNEERIKRYVSSNYQVDDGVVETFLLTGGNYGLTVTTLYTLLEESLLKVTEPTELLHELYCLVLVSDTPTNGIKDALLTLMEDIPVEETLRVEMGYAYQNLIVEG